jgi:regulator of sigma E protease
VAAACDEIRIIVQSTVRAGGQLSSGNASQLSGPIGIAKLSGQVASESWLGLVELAALISVSIGFINLFPIPPLDGGLLLYYAFEALRGRPLGERAQDLGLRVGLALVFGLMILATWNDLARLNLF